MAIAAGRRLSDRLFGGLEGAKADYSNVPVRPFSCLQRHFSCRHRTSFAFVPPIELVRIMRHVPCLLRALQVFPCAPCILLVTPDGGFLAPANRHHWFNGGGSHQGARRRQDQGLLQHGMADQATPFVGLVGGVAWSVPSLEGNFSRCPRLR